MHLSLSVAAVFLLTPTLGVLHPRDAYVGGGHYKAKGNVGASSRDVYSQNIWHVGDTKNHPTNRMQGLGKGIANIGSRVLDMAPALLDESRFGGGAQHGKLALQTRSPSAEAYADATPYTNKLRSSMYARTAIRRPKLRPRSPGAGSSRPMPGRSSGHGAAMAGPHMILPSHRPTPGPSAPDSPTAPAANDFFTGDSLTINTLENAFPPPPRRRPPRMDPLFPSDSFYDRPNRPKRSKVSKHSMNYMQELHAQISSHPSLLAMAAAAEEGASSGSALHGSRRASHTGRVGENALSGGSAGTRRRIPGLTSEIQPYKSSSSSSDSASDNAPRTPNGRYLYTPPASRGRTPRGGRSRASMRGGSSKGSPSGTPNSSNYESAQSAFSETTQDPTAERRKKTKPAQPHDPFVILSKSGPSTPGRSSRWSNVGHMSDEEEVKTARFNKYDSVYRQHYKAQNLANLKRLRALHPMYPWPKTEEEKKAEALKEKEKAEEERRRKGLTSTKPWNAIFIGAAGLGGVLGVGASTAAVVVSEQGARAAQKGATAALAQVQIQQQNANASSAQVRVQEGNVQQAIKQVKIQTADEQSQKLQAQAALAQVKVNQQNANASSQQALIQTQEEGIQVAQMKIAAQQAATALAVAQKGGANITQGVPLPGLSMSKRFIVPRKHLADKLVYYGSDKNLLLRDIAARIIAPMGLS